MKQMQKPRCFPRCNWRQSFFGIGILGIAALAFCYGRWNPLPQANALPPTAVPKKGKEVVLPAAELRSDYSNRAVAYIHGTTVITREELGEYLIAREGAEKLQFLINRRIIEHACKEKGIDVTQAEVEAALAQDLKDLGLTLKDFEKRLLKEYRKNVYEWKEDVIWPKLTLTKLCRDRVRVEQEDLDKAFQAYYGPKVEGRAIFFPAGQEHVAMKLWPKLRDSEEEFNRQAKQQANSLAAKGGKLERPIGRYTTGNEKLEKRIFALHRDEISEIVEMPDGGCVIFKCDNHIPADKNVKLETVRAVLGKEIIDKKVQLEMPKFFKELRDQAQPVDFLKKTKDGEDIQREVRKMIQPEADFPDRGR